MRRSHLLEGKRVLVTGGTGSLGRVLVGRILSGEMGSPRSVTVLSRDEGKHYQMKVDWKHEVAPTDDIFYHNFEELLEFRVGDVRDYSSLVPALRNAEVVFHAAALKQVPSCEYFPYEAARTNIDGAHNLVQAIRSNDTPVEQVVGLSTDKACKPVNVMGMTKALQERILLEGNMGQKEVDFTCVRYGNVISSRGSVLPLFKSQIERGGPVTLTSKEMTRFLLSIDDAVDTVFDSLLHAERGEIFVPQLPSVRIFDLVNSMIGDRHIEIELTGTRPGEKLHEVMVSEEEAVRAHERPGTFRDYYYAISSGLPEVAKDLTSVSILDEEYSSKTESIPIAQVAELLWKSGHISEEVFESLAS